MEPVPDIHDLFQVSDSWRQAYPGAVAGALFMSEVANPANHPTLEALKAQLEDQLRASYAGQTRAELKALATIQAYSQYYRPFKKSYHVLLQLESAVFNSRPIGQAAALVEAMFMAELKNLLLTAGHDTASLALPVRLDVARGDEQYTLLNGQEQVLKPGDMFMADGQGVISSVIYGPDARTRITPHTRRAFFAVYAPAGIGAEAVSRHLSDIETYARAIAPQAVALFSGAFAAG